MGSQFTYEKGCAAKAVQEKNFSLPLPSVTETRNEKTRNTKHCNVDIEVVLSNARLDCSRRLQKMSEKIFPVY